MESAAGISGQYLNIAMPEHAARDDGVRQRNSLVNQTPLHEGDSVTTDENLEEGRAGDEGEGSASDALKDLTWRYHALHLKQEWHHPFDSTSCSAIIGNTGFLPSTVCPVSRAICTWYVRRGRPSFKQFWVRSNRPLDTVGYLSTSNNRWPESCTFKDARGKLGRNAAEGDEVFTPLTGARPPHGSYLRQRGNTVCDRYHLNIVIRLQHRVDNRFIIAVRLR